MTNSGCQVIKFYLAALQADAIARKLQNVYDPEPLTHDFICSIIENLGAVLKYVTVCELKGDTYHAKAVLERENKSIEIDCRPSDAFAVAVRTGAPIFIAEEVLIKSGVMIDEIRKLDEVKEE